MDKRQIFYAYIATLVALFLVVIVAAILAFNERYVEALGIGSVFTGLIALAGRFNTSPTANTEQSDANLATALDKIKPQTTGTGPAQPLTDAPAEEGRE